MSELTVEQIRRMIAMTSAHIRLIKAVARWKEDRQFRKLDKVEGAVYDAYLALEDSEVMDDALLEQSTRVD